MTSNAPAHDFTADKDQILITLKLSLDNGNVVGLFSKALGDNLVLCAVDAITRDAAGTVIMLKETDLYGKLLQERALYLEEIVKACLFITLYDDPIHKSLRDIKQTQAKGRVRVQHS